MTYDAVTDGVQEKIDALAGCYLQDIRSMLPLFGTFTSPFHSLSINRLCLCLLLRACLLLQLSRDYPFRVISAREVYGENFKAHYLVMR